MAKLTWEELDALTSADEIANRLRSVGVKGYKKHPTSCPLARATGWNVTCDRELLGESYPLTRFEDEFVVNFDGGFYPDLIDEA